MKNISIPVNTPQILSLVEQSLKADIVAYCLRHKPERYCLTDIIGGWGWNKSNMGWLYTGMYYPLYDNTKSAGQQLGKVFKKAALSLNHKPLMGKNAKQKDTMYYFPNAGASEGTEPNGRSAGSVDS